MDDDLLTSESNQPSPAPDEVRQPSPRNIGLIAVLFEAGLGVVAIVVGWLVGVPALATLKCTPAGLGWGVLATVPPILGLLLFDRYPVGPLKDLKRIVAELIVPLFRGMAWWQMALVAAAAGLGEELLFRGFIQAGIAGWLTRWLDASLSHVAALLLASVLFGAVHAITRTYAALCVLMGLYLGGLWLLTGNLLVPIIVHGLYDFVALLYLVPQASAVSKKPNW